MSTDEITPDVAEAPAAPVAAAPSAAPAASPAGYVIPDFAEDARTIASFEAARERFERSESQSAEDEIRLDFKRRREVLQAEINTAQAVIDERQARWEKALQAYGKRYPKLVEKTKARKPSFMQNLMSFGSASKMYQATVDASADLNDARSLRRRKEHDDEELDTLQRRALAKLEETLRDKSKGKDHQEKFLSRPGNAALAKRVQEIQAERAAYAARLEAGKVPPLEHRDRHFAQLEAAPLEAPFSGVAIVGVETYGELCYLIFRDRERRHFYHAFDCGSTGSPIRCSTSTGSPTASRPSCTGAKASRCISPITSPSTCATTSAPSRKRAGFVPNCASRAPRRRTPATVP